MVTVKLGRHYAATVIAITVTRKPKPSEFGLRELLPTFRKQGVTARAMGRGMPLDAFRMINPNSLSKEH